MADKNKPELTDSTADKSSEELFLSGSEKDDALRKKSQDGDLKLDDAQEELSLQNILRGSEQLEHPNTGVEQKGGSPGEHESQDIKSVSMEQSAESEAIVSELGSADSSEQESGFSGEMNGARETVAQRNSDQDTKRVLFNDEDESGQEGQSQLLADGENEDLPVSENDAPVVGEPEIEIDEIGGVDDSDNTAPDAGDNVAVNVEEGGPVVDGQILATDVDPGATLNYQVVDGATIPDGFSLSGDGNWQFDAQGPAYDHLSPGDSITLTVPVIVTDEYGASDTTQINITVTGTNDAPVTDAIATSVNEGAAPITGQLTSLDPDSDAAATFTLVSGSSVPDGFIFNADGSYSFDASNTAYNHLNVGDSEVLSVPVIVTDDAGATSNTQIQITVVGTNDAPVTGVSVTANVNEGAASINGQLTSTDVDDGATATFTVASGSSAPGGFVLNADGSYSFDPSDNTYDHLAPGDSEVLTIPVTVTDDNGATATTQIQVTVSGTNDAPVASAAAVNVDEGSTLITGQLVSTDLDDGATATFSIASGSSAPDGFVLNSDGSYSFDPADNAYESLNAGDSAVLTIPVTVTDEYGATDTAQIQITVAGTNDAPVAGAAITASVNEGDAVISGQFISTDVDNSTSGNWSVSAGSSTPDGFVLNADGSYSFDPSNNAYDHLNVGDSTVLTIPVTVTDDNGATDTAQIQITVSGTNDMPVAGASITALINEGGALVSGQLTSTDLDDSATATFTIASGSSAPDGFVLNADGSYSFDPSNNTYDHLNVGDSTVLTIPVTVTDDNGASDTSQIQITVSGTNDLPVIGITAALNVSEGGASINGQLTSTDVDDGATATYTVSAGSSTPAGFVLNADGSYSFDPSDSAYDSLNVGDSVVLTVPVSVTDDNGGVGTSQVQITVSGTNDLPVAGASVITSVNEDAAVINGQLTVTDSDLGATAGWSVSTGSSVPDGFVLNTDGSYSFDPSDSAYDHLNVGDATVLTIPVTVTDDNGATDTAQIQITVSGTNDAPIAGANVTTSVNEGAAVINGQLTSMDSDDGAASTWSVSAGNSTPDGFVLNADGSYSFDPADSAYDHLNVGDSTVLAIPIIVTDDNGATDTAQIQITVSGTNDAPIAGVDVTTSVNEGTAVVNGQLTSTDNDDAATASWSVSAGNAVPDGFVLNSDGNYSFDPADTAYNHLNVGDSTVLTIPVTVTDDNGATDTAQIQITVSGTNDAPVAGANVTTSVNEGAAVINGQLTSTDADDGATASFTLSSGSTAPDGFVLNADGSYSFDPSDSAYDHLNVGDATVLTIPVTVTDDNGASDTAQIQITVAGTNDAPIAGANVTSSVNEGAAIINGQLTSTDVDDGATAAFTISSGSTAPDGFVLNADGSYSFDPADSAYDHLNVGDSTVLTIQVTVTDDNGATDTAQIQVTVSGTNDAPVAGANVTSSVNEGAAVINGQLTSTDSDDAATSTWSVTTGNTAPNGFVINADGSYSFDPADSAYDNFNVGDSTVLTIPVTVTDDNGATDTAQIQITVSGTNDAPIAGANVTTSVNEGAAVINGQLTSTDSDDAATSAWAVSSGSSAPAGFVLNADGSYSFDPADNAYDQLNVGDSTVLTIPITVTDDNGATDTMQIQITVSGTNDAPVAGANVTSSVNEGAAVVNGQLTSTDSDDAATSAWTVSSGSSTPAGFVLNADGSYSFDPADTAYDNLNVGDSTVLTIPVTVTDDNGATDTAQIQVTVFGTNDVPIAGANVTSSVNEGAAVINGQLISTDSDDAATSTWSVSTGNAAPDGFVINADGSYSFDPADSAYDHLNVGDSTVLTIPVTVTDDNGATDTTQIQITVSGTNDAPIAGANVTASVNEGAAVINGQLTSMDLDDGATASFTVSPGSTIPDGFVLNVDGSYSFDPSDSAYNYLNVGDTAVLTVPVTVTDDNGATDTAQVQITVSGTNSGPVAGVGVTVNINEGAAIISGQLTSTDADAGATATFSITSGSSVPDGFVLNADGSYSFDPADSAYDHLNVGDSTVLTIPVTVADGSGATDTTQIQITVSGTNDAPVAGAAVTTAINEGSVAISGQLTSTDLDDGATSTWSISVGNSAPDGFVINTDGSYSFDPSDTAYDHLNVGDSTVLTIPVTVTDDNGATDTAQIQITVSGTNDAPIAGANVTSSANEGGAVINGQLTSTDVDDGATAAFTISSGSTAPDGFVLNADGSYSFDPADSAYDHLNVGDSEVVTIPVTVTDDNGATDTAQIQITVSGTNDAPVAGANVTSSVNEGAAVINGQLTSTDADDGATASFTISSGSTAPDGFVLNADGSYSFDPADAAYDNLNVGDSTVLTIPVTVTDDNGATDTAQIQITVSGTNDAPIAGANVTSSVNEGAAVINGQLTSTDSDDGATASFTVSSGSTVPDGFVLNSDGSYSFDPADTAYDHLNVGDSTVLTIPVMVTDDNGATDTAQIQITVSGTNDAPVAGANVTTSVNEGAAVINGQLTSTDVDDGATASFTLSSGSTAPDGFVLNADGSYSFDPSDSAYDHLNIGDATVLTIPVTVTDDNGASDTAQIQITVAGTNDAPIAGANVTSSVNEGGAVINGQLTSTDVDDGATAAFTISLGSTAPDGFVLNADGSYSFDPADSTYDHLNVGDSTVLTIPVTVTDDNGATDTAQIQVTVSGTNDVPVAGANVTSSANEGGAVINGQLTSTDVDDGATAAFTISSGSTAPDGFVLNTDGSYSFDPADSAYDHLNVGDSEVVTIPVTVTDDNGATDTAQIQITVSGTNDAPVAGANVTSSVNEGEAVINGQLTSTDVDDGATAAFTISSGSTAPDGFVINADGSYSFDPADSAYDHLNVGDSTVLTIPVTVTDDNGATDTAQIQITVSGTNDAPVAGANVTSFVNEGAAVVNGQLTSTDSDDAATASWSVTAGNSAPDGFVINADGSYSFDPTDSAYDNLNVGDSTVLTIPVTVTDDNGATDTAQIQITVSGTNDAPIAGANVTTSVNEGAAVINGQLTSTDSDDAATASWSVNAGSAAPDGFVLNTDGSYSFDPADAAYDHLNVGDATVLTIPVTVTDDNGATDTAQIQITVSGTNDAPIAGANVTTSVNEGAAVINGQLTSTDSDDAATASFTVSSGSTVPDGFVLNSDGSYSFDPADTAYDHLNVGDATVLTIPVTVTDDNGATDTTQIQITVSGTNDAPVAGANVTSFVNEGAAVVNGQLTSTDLDDGATASFTISVGSSAPDGFVLNTDGSYSFDPADSAYDHLNVGDATVLTIPVTVTDDNGATDTAQIQITVSGTNDAPIAGANVTASVNEDAVVINGQLTSTDVDDGATAAFTISVGSSAPDGFVLNADGSYSFDPADSAYDHLNVGDSEVVIIPVTVTDDNGATDTAQIQITVSGTNDAPIAGANVTSSVNEGGAVINGQLTSADVDDGAISTWSVTTGSSTPDGFVINADGSYSFDPADSAYDHLNVGDSTVLTIPVTITDDNGATDTTQIQITVSGTNDVPIAGANVTSSVNEGGAIINGQLTSTDADDGATAAFTISSGSTAPDGFVLNADGSYSFDPADSAYDHLNVGDATVLTIPVTVTDDNGATDTTQIQITVSGTNDAPVAGANVISSVNEGAAVINGQLTSTDSDDAATASWSVSAGSTAPDGFVLNTDGSYSFDPADTAYDHLNVGDSTVLTIPVTVTDDNGATDTAQIQITVSGTNDAPVAGANVTSFVNEGAAVVNGQLTSTDSDDGATASFTISSGSTAPDGFVLNADGSYSFDPADSAYDHLNVGDSEVVTIPVTVTDDNGATDTAQIQITVSGTNDAPVAGANVTSSVNEGAAVINGQLTSTDSDDTATASWSVSAGSAAPNGFVLNIDGSYSFDPSDSAYDNLNVGDSTVLTIPVTVTDDNGATDTAQIQITVSGTNDAPVAGANVTSFVNEGAAVVNGQLTSTDSDDGATASFTISSGSTAPDGFVLNADGSYSFDPADSAYDHLNVGDSEVVTIPVTVTDDNGATDTAQIQITVSGTNDAPVAGANVTSFVNEGAAVVNGQLTSTDLDDGATAAFTISSGSTAPDGFVLNADGSYSFDPADSAYDHLNVGDSTVLTIPVTVTDDNGATDAAQIQVTVSGTNDAPVAGANVTSSVNEGAAVINGQLTSTDSDDAATSTWSVTAGSSSPGGFVINADGSYSFDPTDSAYDHLNVGDSTVLTIPVTVTDDNGATDTAQIQITVSGTNDAPVAGANVTSSVNEGAAVINGQLTSTDVDDGATSTWSVTAGNSAPDGFVINGDGSYSFDPSDTAYDHLNVGDSTVLTIPVTVTDDNGTSDTAQIQITVSGTNDAPVAGANVTSSVNEGAAVINGQLTSTDSDDAATSAWSVTAGNGAPDGFVINTDGSYSFDPADSAYDHLNVGDSTVLTIPVTVTDDNGATDTAQIQITVSGTNDAPIAGANVTSSVNEGAAIINGQLTSTDSDDAATSSWSVTAGNSTPDGFILNSDGSYSFDPADSAYDHLNVGDSTVLTIPVTVTDENGATDTAQIQVTVLGTNDAPIAGANVTASVNEGAAVINGALASTDVDDGATVSWGVSAGSTVPDGFVLNADGSYSFDPSDSAYDHLNVGDSTVLTIPVTVTDDNGTIDTAQIQITVSGTNDAPVVGANVTTSVNEGAVVINGQLTSTDSDDAATSSWSVTAGNSAPDGFILNSDGSYSFDPSDSAYDHLNIGDSEVVTIPVTVTDDNGATDTAQIEITVSGTNDAPVAGANVTASVNEGAAVINGQLTSTDADDGATSTFTISAGSTAPDGFALNSDGSYSFDPADTAYDHLNIGDTTVLTIPVTVTDENGATDTTQVQITVSGTNDAPVAFAAISVNVNEGANVISGQLGSTDVDDGAVVTFAVSSGSSAPAGFILNADGSASFDPANSAYNHLNVGDSEVLTIPITVTDEHGATDTSQIQITVRGTNDSPVANASITSNVNEGSAVINGQFTSTDVDDGATASWSISAGSSAPSGFVLNADGTYSFDPADSSYDHLNVGDSEVITVPVTVTDDNGATDTSQIQITISGTNDAPVAGASVITSVNEGGAIITGQISASDVDDSAAISFSVSAGNSAPDGFIINPDGSYSFDPTDTAYNSLNAGDSTVLTIPVTVTDEHGATDTTQIQITVQGTNDAPVVQNVDLGATNEDTSILITESQLLANSSDADAGATLSVSSLTLGDPSQGALTDNGNGTWSFSPANNYSADDVTFDFTVSDGTATDTGNAIIDIVAVADAPTITVTHSGATNTHDVISSVSSTTVAPSGFVISVDGWQTTSDAIEQRTTYTSSEGNWHYELNTDPADYYPDAANMYQDIQTQSGASYELNFDFSARPGVNASTSRIEVLWDGVVIDTISADGSGLSDTSWTAYNYTVTGDGDISRLEFREDGVDVNYGRGGFLDNISLTETTSGFTATGDEDTTIALPELGATLNDIDGSESVSLTVGDIPVGAIFTDGANSFTASNGATSVDISSWNGATLSVTPPSGFDGQFDLTLTATSTESSNGDTSSTVETLTVNVVDDHTENVVNSIYGNTSSNNITGTTGDDYIAGREGNDTIQGGAGDDVINGGAGNDAAYGQSGNDTYVMDLSGGDDYFSGGAGGGWTDAIDVSAMTAIDPDNPWTIAVNGSQVQYDLAANALELNPDTAGVITFGDGSELTFADVERIEW